MDKINEILDVNVLNKLSKLPKFTIIEIDDDSKISVYDGFRDLEDGCPSHTFQKTTWQDALREALNR